MALQAVFNEQRANLLLKYLQWLLGKIIGAHRRRFGQAPCRHEDD